MKTMQNESERRMAEEVLAELVRWERYFDSAGTQDDGLSACETSRVQLGFSRTGFLSTRFACRFAIGRLTVDCENELRVLELESGNEDQRWLDALATVRMAILLLRDELNGREWLANDPEATVRIAADRAGASFSITDGAGEECVSEAGWEGLVRILDRELQSDEFAIRV